MSATAKKIGRNPFEKKNKRTPRTAGKKRVKPQEVTWREITHEWIPRVRACAYVRILKFVSRFA